MKRRTPTSNNRPPSRVRGAVMSLMANARRRPGMTAAIAFVLLLVPMVALAGHVKTVSFVDPPATVRAEDLFTLVVRSTSNNPSGYVPQPGETVVLHVVSGPVGGQLAGTLTREVMGTALATFPDLSLTLPGSYTIMATNVHGGGPTTATIVINAGAPRDQTPPSISVALSPAAPDGAAGWYRGTVVLTWTVVEPESPATLVLTGCQTPVTINADQAATTYTCAASSEGGAAGPVSVTVRRDATPPTITPQFSAAPVNGWYAAPVTLSFACADALSGIASDCGLAPILFGEGHGSYDVTASDAAGNTARATGIVPVDATPPTILAVLSPPRPASGWYNAQMLTPSVLVTCADAPTATASGIATCPSTHIFAEGANLEWSGVAIDRAGHRSTPATISGVNVDRTAPVMTTVPEDITLHTRTGSASAPAYACAATDAGSGLAGPIAYSHAPGSSFSLGETVVTCTVTDVAGNAASGRFTVTVIDVSDVTPPVITHTLLPAAPDGANGWYRTDVTLTWLIAEPESPATLVTSGCESPRAIVTDQAATVYRCEASSEGGAATPVSVTVRRDATPPTIEVESSASPVDGWFAAPVTVTFRCADATSGIAADCGVAPRLFGEGRGAYDVTVLDAAGNPARITGDVLVDATPPTIAATLLPARPASGWYNAGMVAPVVTSVCADAPSAIASGVVSCPEAHTFPEGAGLSWSGAAVDRAGHRSTPATVEGVNVDRTAPTFVSIPEDITLYTYSQSATAPAYSCAAQDDGSGIAGPMAYSHAPGSSFPVGTTEVACDTADIAGNPARAAFTITVIQTQDATPPTIAPSVIGTLGSDGWYVSDVRITWTVDDPETDIETLVGCDAIDVTADQAAVVYVCSATNGAGLTSEARVTIARDTVAPDVRAADIHVPATGDDGAVVSAYACSASDALDPAPALAYSIPPGSTFPEGQTTPVVCEATDLAGNAASVQFAVVVGGWVPPDVSAPTFPDALPTIVAEAAGPEGAYVPFTIHADDDRDGRIEAVCDPASGSRFAMTDTTVRCTATDAAGNVAATSFVISIRDTIAPVLSLPLSLTVQAASPEGASIAYAATAWDAVSGHVAVLCEPASGAWLPVGTTLVSCSATDDAGNQATGVFPATVLAPSIFGTLASIRVDGPDVLGVLASGEFRAIGIDDGGAELLLERFVRVAPPHMGSMDVCYVRDGITGCRVVSVHAGSLARIVLSGPSVVVVGSPVSFGLRGFDQHGNIVPLGASYVDHVARSTPGRETVSYQERGVIGSQGISVIPGVIETLRVTGPAALEAGESATYDVSAVDARGNAVPLDPSSFAYTAPMRNGWVLVCHEAFRAKGCMDVEIHGAPAMPIRSPEPPGVEPHAMAEPDAIIESGAGDDAGLDGSDAFGSHGLSEGIEESVAARPWWSFAFAFGLLILLALIALMLLVARRRPKDDAPETPRK